MKIAGIIENSLIDYPGKVSTVIFTQGCNMKCGYCHNPELINKNPLFKSYFSEEKFFDFLNKQKKWLDGVVLLGGEPTLQVDLPSFCKKIKKDTGMSIKLDTNGLNPIMLETLLDRKLIDYVAMDVKVSKLIDANYLWSKNLLINLKFPHEFRLTCCPTDVNDDNIGLILQQFTGAEKLYLQNFRSENTLDKRLRKVTPYLNTKLEEWRDKYKPHYKFIGVR